MLLDVFDVIVERSAKARMMAVALPRFTVLRPEDSPPAVADDT